MDVPAAVTGRRLLGEIEEMSLEAVSGVGIHSRYRQRVLRTIGHRF